MMTKSCVKCPETGVVRLNHKDSYCRSCFLHYFKHRFRSTLGKRKIFDKDEPVLICFSGGLSSSALLDLVYKATEGLDDKRLKVKPSVLFLIENHQLITGDIFSTLEKYSLVIPVHLAYLSEVLYLDDNFPLHSSTDLRSDAFPVDINAETSLSELLKSVRSETSLLDLYERLKLLALMRCATKLKFSYLFMGHCSSILASNYFADVALGRGDQIVRKVDLVEKIDFRIGHCDDSTNVTLVKPLRDIDIKALTFYNKFNGIETFINEPEEVLRTRHNVHQLSIQRETSDFVVDLTSRFPSTVATLMSTASKLACASVPLENDATKSELCLLCRHRILKLDHIFELDSSKECATIDESYYCYGCRTILRDIDNLNVLPKIICKIVDL